MCLFWVGKPRIGVLNVEGKALGFVFIDLTNSLSVLRRAIDDQVPVLLANLTHTLVLWICSLSFKLMCSFTSNS